MELELVALQSVQLWVTQGTKQRTFTAPAHTAGPVTSPVFTWLERPSLLAREPRQIFLNIDALGNAPSWFRLSSASEVVTPGQNTTRAAGSLPYPNPNDSSKSRGRLDMQVDNGTGTLI